MSGVRRDLTKLGLASFKTGFEFGSTAQRLLMLQQRLIRGVQAIGREAEGQLVKEKSLLWMASRVIDRVEDGRDPGRS